MSTNDPLLSVTDLRVEFPGKNGVVQAVNGVSFEIERGEAHGFVGESGAGKTVTGLSVLGMVDSPGRITGGEVRFDGRDLLSLSSEELRSIRGKAVSMIFQDPMTALNPGFTVGRQISDTIREHSDATKAEARERTIELLDDVGIPDPEARIDDYPHQYSGGMCQRAAIALAISCEPELVIADEPTTALDVTTQAQILALLEDLQETYDLSIQVITHNMGVISELCDRVSVMYAGEIVETGAVRDVFDAPKHPYTVSLMKAIPRLNDARDRIDTVEGTAPDLTSIPSGCSFRDRCPHATDACAEADVALSKTCDGSDGRSIHDSSCVRQDELDLSTNVDARSNRKPVDSTLGEPLVEVNSLRKYFDPESQTWLQKLLGDQQYVHAVDDVSLTIHEGETFGLVGESGCGKTTLGRVITNLYEADDGTVVYAGSNLTEADRREMREARSDVQMIFQNPFSSLNPRRTVREILSRPMEIHGVVETEAEKERRLVRLLEDIGLNERHLDRYPREFSGGQKQRIGIARALALSPDFIVADEPVSALDVSVQAKVLNLLNDLQDTYDLTYLFISHNLNVVQYIADRIGVMYLGELVEVGTVEEVFQPPYHPYTKILLSSVPTLETGNRDRILPEGEPASPIDPPSGCRFHTRCPYAMPECETEAPKTIESGDVHTIDCHLFDDEIITGSDREDADHLDDLFAPEATSRSK